METETIATDFRWHYNLGCEEEREANLEAIDLMRDTGKYDKATLEELERRIQNGS